MATAPPLKVTEPSVEPRGAVVAVGGGLDVQLASAPMLSAANIVTIRRSICVPPCIASQSERSWWRRQSRAPAASAWREHGTIRARNNKSGRSALATKIRGGIGDAGKANRAENVAHKSMRAITAAHFLPRSKN